jgi:small subunit ribosomal protein S6
MAETQAAKRLREYETIFLVKPELTDDNVDRLKDRVRGIVSREGGKVIRFTVWGKKKTLYPVGKQPRAIYVHTHYLGDSKMVAEVERNLRNIDEVTRYLSVKIADEVDPESRPVLEDVKMAGDVEETRPGAAPEREVGFRSEPVDDVADPEEEAAEEA